MSDLKSREKIIIQKYLETDSGYVCDFSNQTFADFFTEVVDIDIYDDKYQGYSGSKASRLRAFWDTESNQIVSKLLDEMIDYWKDKLTIIKISGYRKFDKKLYDESKKIIIKLKENNPIENADALIPNSKDEDFSMIAKSIKDSIDNGKPEEAIDRLHTFMVKYLRVLCSKSGMKYDKNTPLNALIGAYIKYLKDKNKIESEMSEKILSSSIKVLESFNNVRNNQSLAHDNKLLNKEESWLIFSYISSITKFISSIENKIIKEEKDSYTMTEEDIKAEAAGEAWMEMQMDISRGK